MQMACSLTGVRGGPSPDSTFPPRQRRRDKQQLVLLKPLLHFAGDHRCQLTGR